MTDEAAVPGRSYWDIVTRAFRRNVVARVALWITTALLALAILTPLLANDRPYAFKGTMPGEYRRAYSQVVRGAWFALLSLPQQLRAEREQFEQGTATLLQLKTRIPIEDLRTIYDPLERLRRRAESRPDIRGRWVSGDVTLREIASELAPAEAAALESATRRIRDGLPALYRDRLRDILTGIETKIGEMADQLDPALRPKAAAVAALFRQATPGDYVFSAGGRTPALDAAKSAFQETLAPDRVTLVPAWRFPIFDALTALDVFFIVAALLAALAFGPLAWAGLRRLRPAGRRLGIQASIAILPAAALALLFLALHHPRFGTVSYKAGLKDGSIVAESAFWPPHRYRYDEVPEDAAERRSPPSRAHPLGTDFMGRDLLARMLWGSRISLSIGFLSTAIAVVLGVGLGALAGFYGGWVDIAISRLIEWMICFPRFFLILAVVAFLPPSIYYVMLVLGLFGWMGIARLQRGEFLRLQNQDYVTAAAALGAREGRIMFRHLLPNSLAPVLVAASFGIASAMLLESGLSFLGFGVQEPATSWGQILFTAHGQKEWWTLVIPGAAIFVAVTCYNLVGDGIRDAVDPRLKV